jgi:hypothetical protein
VNNIASNSNGKRVCCLDFLINDVAKSSFKQALTIERAYDNSRIPGLVYCAYKAESFLGSEIKDMIELFEMHDQIFIEKKLAPDKWEFIFIIQINDQIPLYVKH